MVQFFEFISIIADYLFTFISLPALVVDSLITGSAFINATAMSIHPDVGAFVSTYTSGVMFVSLLLPLLRDFF